MAAANKENLHTNEYNKFIVQNEEIKRNTVH